MKLIDILRADIRESGADCVRAIENLDRRLKAIERGIRQLQSVPCGIPGTSRAPDPRKIAIAAMKRKMPTIGAWDISRNMDKLWKERPSQKLNPPPRWGVKNWEDMKHENKRQRTKVYTYISKIKAENPRYAVDSSGKQRS